MTALHPNHRTLTSTVLCSHWGFYPTKTTTATATATATVTATVTVTATATVTATTTTMPLHDYGMKSPNATFY